MTRFVLSFASFWRPHSLAHPLFLQADTNADIIRADRANTVTSLTSKLIRICRAGGHDGGFPVVEKEAGGLRLRGVIAVNEMEHALCELRPSQ